MPFRVTKLNLTFLSEAVEECAKALQEDGAMDLWFEDDDMISSGPAKERALLKEKSGKHGSNGGVSCEARADDFWRATRGFRGSPVMTDYTQAPASESCSESKMQTAVVCRKRSRGSSADAPLKRNRTRREHVTLSSPIRARSKGSFRDAEAETEAPIAPGMDGNAIPSSDADESVTYAPDPVFMRFSETRSGLEELYREAMDLTKKNEKLQRKLEGRQKENALLRRKIKELRADNQAKEEKSDPEGRAN